MLQTYNFMKRKVITYAYIFARMFGMKLVEMYIVEH